MDVSSFPFDAQQCRIEVASLSQPEEELVVYWEDSVDAPSINSRIELPGFEVAKISRADCSDGFFSGKLNSCRSPLPHLSAALLSSLSFMDLLHLR